MAGLQVNYTDPTVAGGATFPQAYCHIDGANMADLNSTLIVNVGVYVDQAHFASGKPPVITLQKVLTPADAATLRATFASTVYTLLAAGVSYPPFSGGVLVP